MKRALVALVVVVVGAVVAAFVLLSQTATVVVVRVVSGVPVIEISGPVDGPGARKIIRALHQVEKNKPTAILISFDSPGGEVSSTLEAAEAISGAAVPTLAWVKEGVGGTIFMIAAVDEIYLSPTGVCGAAGFPLGGNDPKGDGVRTRVLSYVGAKIRSLATAHGHDPEVFLAMMDARTELVRGAKVWKTKGQLLSLTASEARGIGLSAGTAGSLEAIIAGRAK